MLIKLLDNYAAKPGPYGDLMIIQGTSEGSLGRTHPSDCLGFNADWIIGQTVGIYPVSNSTPEPICAELNRIIDAGQGGLSQDLVKLEPISRQNAITCCRA